MSLRFLLTAVLPACLFAVACPTLAQSPAQVRVAAIVNQYTNDDSLGVAVVELDGRWIGGVQELAGRLAGDEAADVVNHPGFALARGMVESFRSAGARELVLLVGLHDFSNETLPVLAITVEQPEQAKAVAELARSLQQMAGGKAPVQIADVEGHVLIGQQASIERARSVKPQHDTRLAKAADLLTWAEAKGEPMAGVLLAPGDSFRRVVRALWPDLPRPFESLTGALIADDVEQLVVLVRCPPEWKLKVGLGCNSQRAAEQLEQLMLVGQKVALEELAKAKEAKDAEPSVSLLERAGRVLVPTREGQSLVLDASHDTPEIIELTTAVILQPIQAARDAARRNQRLNNLKQMALAMHNFHDTNKHFPASAAIVDKEGKPLLSWRVALLPYFDQRALFNEFHLDEPWDSPHNLKLAATVPDVYVNPSFPKLSLEGKTNYLVPVHPHSVFPPVTGEPVEKRSQLLGQDLYLAAGTEFKSIKDGTSQTLLVVEAPPELAVPWTKPADWEVDLATALEVLRRGEAKLIGAAYCDGSAHVWDLDDESLKENLPKFITRDGREVIEWK